MLSLIAADLPPKRALLTGFNPVLTLSPANLHPHLTGGASAVTGTGLRAPLRDDQPEWPLIDLTAAIREPWQRLGATREVLLEVRGRALKPRVNGSFSLVWNEPTTKRRSRLSFRMGSSTSWQLVGINPEANGRSWLTDDQQPAASPPLHSIGWLLRRDTVWAVVDNRPVAAYPRPWSLFGLAGSHLGIELDGDGGQTLEIASVRLLAGPANPGPVPVAVATPVRSGTPRPAGASAPAAALVPARPKPALPLGPTARPTGLTLVADLADTRLKAVVDSLNGDVQSSRENGLVVFHCTAASRREIMVPLPAAMLRAYQRRLLSQGLLLEVKARLRSNAAAHFGRYGLKLDANNLYNNATLTYGKLYQQEYGSWELSASPSQEGPQEAAGPAGLLSFHTLGFYARGDSLTVYFDDRPVGQPLPARGGMQTLLAGGGNFFLHLFGSPGQDVEVSYVRLSAQNEAAFAAQHAAEAAAEASRPAAPQPTPTTYAKTPVGASPTRTTASGVQYSTADMSQFTRQPGAVSGYATGAGAASDKCGRCHGFGKINTRPNPCTYCGGTGGSTAFVSDRTWTERGPTGQEYRYQSTEGKQQFVVCSHCSGGPNPVWAVCPTCHGTGR